MPGEQRNATDNLNWLPDTPACLDRDLLDYRSYSDTIVSIIRGLPQTAAFTLGIFGSWGIGKTSLLKMIRTALGRHGIHSIWVNVWKIGTNEEDVWRAFLQALLMDVKHDLPWYNKWLFHLGLLGRQIN